MSENKFMDSIKKNYIGILIILFASLLTATGQMFWKMSKASDLELVIAGFALYGIGAVLMVMAFRFGSLSVIHPMLSFGYVFAVFFGIFFLGEHLSFVQIAGIATIISGVILIGGGDV